MNTNVSVSLYWSWVLERHDKARQSRGIHFLLQTQKQRISVWIREIWSRGIREAGIGFHVATEGWERNPDLDPSWNPTKCSILGAQERPCTFHQCPHFKLAWGGGFCSLQLNYSGQHLFSSLASKLYFSGTSITCTLVRPVTSLLYSSLCLTHVFLAVTNVFTNPYN